MGSTLGYSQVPHGGFANLKPTFKLSIGADAKRIPVAHTCFSQIDIPPLVDANAMAGKLRAFLDNCAESFELA